MTGRDPRRPRWPALLLGLVLLGAGCGGDDGGEDAASGTSEPAKEGAPVDRGPLSDAAQTRSTLDGLLQERVFLAAAATNAALGGRNSELAAATAALEANSAALGSTIDAVLGDEAGQSFEPLWPRHVELLLSYTQGHAAEDTAQRDQAAADLAAFPGEFATAVTTALPTLDQAAVIELVTTHVTTLQSVVDAQAEDDQVAAFDALRAAAGHMSLIGESLGNAIAARAPDRAGGDATNPAADLVTKLHTDLREHVFLISAATGAALGGRAEEFSAAAGALDANSGSLTETISGIYGPETGQAFDTLWKKHITFLVEYTTGHAANDQTARDSALESLAGYPAEFAAFFSAASPTLTADSLSGLADTHISSVQDVIDAQSTQDVAEAYTKLRTAAEHMQALANPMADAVVAQFPDQFTAG